MRRIRIDFKVIVMMVAMGVLWWEALTIIDPDFGWHYKLGEYIYQKGVPRTDPFTYTMPGYPFVDYEWGINLLMYLGEERLGRFLMAGIWSLLCAGAFWVATPTEGRKYWWWGVWLGIAVALSRFTIRPQVLSWLFSGMVIRLLADVRFGERNKWMFVPLMWIWTNLHGSYFLGLGLWGVWWVVKMIGERKLYVKELMVGFFGLVVTLLNPYGLRNWQEVLMQMGQTKLFAAALEEWRPFWEKIDLAMMAMVVWVVGIGLKLKNKLTPEESIVGGIALFAGLSSLRHGVLTMIILTPISAKLWVALENYLISIKRAGDRWKVFGKWAMVLAGIILVLEMSLLVKHYSSGAGWKFPDKAVRYLKSGGYERNLLANYGWGGFLIWKLPEEKVFIDGRMSGWWWEEAPSEQSKHAFREYLAMVTEPERHAQNILTKYQVKTVLWRKEPETIKGVLGEKLKTWDMLAGSGGEKFANWLSSNGWKKSYEDEVSEVYVKQI